MSKRNIALSILALILLVWVLFKALATAWVAMKLLPMVAMLLAFLSIAWIWGRLTR